jgi:hypothetical protein
VLCCPYIVCIWPLCLHPSRISTFFFSSFTLLTLVLEGYLHLLSCPHPLCGVATLRRHLICCILCQAPIPASTGYADAPATCLSIHAVCLPFFFYCFAFAYSFLSTLSHSLVSRPLAHCVPRHPPLPLASCECVDAPACKYFFFFVFTFAYSHSLSPSVVLCRAVSLHPPHPLTHRTPSASAPCQHPRHPVRCIDAPAHHL